MLGFLAGKRAGEIEEGKWSGASNGPSLSLGGEGRRRALLSHGGSQGGGRVRPVGGRLRPGRGKAPLGSPGGLALGSPGGKVNSPEVWDIDSGRVGEGFLGSEAGASFRSGVLRRPRLSLSFFEPESQRGAAVAA